MKAVVLLPLKRCSKLPAFKFPPEKTPWCPPRAAQEGVRDGRLTPPVVMPCRKVQDKDGELEAREVLCPWQAAAGRQLRLFHHLLPSLCCKVFGVKEGAAAGTPQQWKGFE